jgi:hypothetical protein
MNNVPGSLPSVLSLRVLLILHATTFTTKPQAMLERELLSVSNMSSCKVDTAKKNCGCWSEVTLKYRGLRCYWLNR